MAREVEIVRIPVNAGNRQKLIEEIQAARSGYLSAPSCVGFELLADAERNEVVVVVTWSSANTHDESLAGPHCAAFFSKVSALAAGMPEATRYELVTRVLE
jgi:quinol monooxygenase YgiN